MLLHEDTPALEQKQGLRRLSFAEVSGFIEHGAECRAAQWVFHTPATLEAHDKGVLGHMAG